MGGHFHQMLYIALRLFFVNVKLVLVLFVFWGGSQAKVSSNLVLFLILVKGRPSNLSLN